MGEVYRAHDSRLGRDVAVKVLPAAVSRDPERLRRFEQEARATAALNHPNILAVFDIGTHADSPYVVTELLEGETLRQRIQSGPVPARKAIDYALQIARGLSAAHDHAITHRDLKPENVFLTKDGRIKILDFGLAKLNRPQEASGADTPTLAAQTEPGMVLGTVGYMAPEQVRGQAADARSDIFSLGAILYEMVSGKRAFQGDTPADTMSAILKAEPLPLSDALPNTPAGLARIVEHCLEKDAANRFQSARDVAFALEAFSGSSSSTSHASLAPVPARSSWQRRSLFAGLGVGLLLAAVAFVVARRTAPLPEPPAFHELTFQRGYIQAARFAPDGGTIIYSAAWNGKPIELFSTRPEGTESRALGVPDSDLLAVSSTGELAVRLAPRGTGPYSSSGTLARTMLSGGSSPRAMEDGIQFADWMPDGKRLIVVRRMLGRSRLEFPIGTVLYESAGWVGNPRVSPKADWIGFIDHPAIGGDFGDVAVIDFAGHKKTLDPGFSSVQGLAWSPGGDEVWFTGTRAGSARALYGVSLAGKERLIARIPGILNLHDVSRSGQVLLARDNWRVGIIAQAPSAKEQDLSWMDFSAVRDISPDGKLLLFDESGEAGGALGQIYLRQMDGSPPVRLGDGTGCSLSADSKWALTVPTPAQAGNQFVFLPTGTGAPRTIPAPQAGVQWGNLMPNGQEILFSGNEPGHATRIYLQDISSGKTHPVTPEGVSLTSFTRFVSPDGKSFIGVEADGTSSIRSVESGELKPIPGLQPADIAFAWTGDGRSIYVYQPAMPVKVFQIDLSSGQRRLWKELDPPDPAGINFIRTPHISADGKAYAYNYNRVLSDLYLVDGLR